MNTLRLYIRSMGMLLRSHLQYTSSFIMQTIAQLVMEGGEMMAVILIVDRFQSLKRWTGGNLYFFFGMMAVSFYFTELFGRGITGDFPSMVRSGRLDTFLVRPRGVLTQVMCAGADPRRISCIAVGIVALIIGSDLSGIVWSPLKVLVLIEAIVMSCLLILGLFMIEAIFSIFSVKSVELVNAITYGGRSACQYPIDVFPLALRMLFTVVAPFALTLHVPASWILGKPLYGWPWWSAIVTPFSGVMVFGFMSVLFHLALRHYRSTGS
ncbi:ABC transporter permease [Butyrivibrio sp. MC2013]|uniref:ABC transporter permease n=1 Tax=Butyrivibrio sp. MC2013 TaxID=1280686 RepID=UPI00041AAC3B|nr:ABC-2 family transporter protein [Butyrivibrio sp. MC2013]